tara:strand:+ start:550 stop:732 length:183 start_codon:yes stop_codon:yes gene_type:complete
MTIPEIIIKIVGSRSINPAYLSTKKDVLSNNKENNITDIVNTGAAHIMKLLLFFRNGNAK